METNLSSANNPPYSSFNLQAPITNHHHHHHQHHISQPTIYENTPLTIRITQENDQTISLADCTKRDKGKFGSEEDEPSFTDQDHGKPSTWQRVKWMDKMEKLLITAVSYITEEVFCMSGPHRRKLSNLQRKGKWKSVSKAMAERGHFVSPQQCEDKFNDLNKRYKRLNEILGRGTSCEVVENPSLLDAMDHVTEKSKDEVRKILSSKHLHYEEMCSYHNGNRLYLPEDPDLHRSLRLALMPSDHDENDDGVDQELNDQDRFEDSCNHGEHHGGFGLPSKRAKQSSLDEDTKLNHRNLELEEQRINIQAQMLELEKERFKWETFCKKRDRELEVMKMEIERMKLENERMALEIRRKEIGIDDN